MKRAQILEKIEKIEDDSELLDRAIKVRVCPECGETLRGLVGDF